MCDGFNFRIINIIGFFLNFSTFFYRLWKGQLASHFQGDQLCLFVIKLKLSDTTALTLTAS